MPALLVSAFPYWEDTVRAWLLRQWSEVPSLRQGIAAQPHQLLRRRLRPPRSHLRLRLDQAEGQSRNLRAPAQYHVALQGTAADRGRADRRPAHRWHSAG